MDPRAARPGSAVITLLIIYEKNGAELGDPFSAIVCSQEVGSCLLLIFFTSAVFRVECQTSIWNGIGACKHQNKTPESDTFSFEQTEIISSVFGFHISFLAV